MIVSNGQSPMRQLFMFTQVITTYLEDMKIRANPQSGEGGRIALATDCKGPELSHYRSLLNVDELHRCHGMRTTSNMASRIHD